MTILSALDLDLYKITMQQLAWKKHRDVVVKYQLINRNPNVKLGELLNLYELQYKTMDAQGMKFGTNEQTILRQMGLFQEDFLAALSYDYHPSNLVMSKTADGQLDVTVEGPWWKAILWETMIMSIVSEMYNERVIKEKKAETYSIGISNLYAKIEQLRRFNIAFSDFGTRRRFSAEWHGIVLAILYAEGFMCPTSNVYWGSRLNLPIIGTYAHEMDMVYSGIYPYMGYMGAHIHMMKDWIEMYPMLDTALTDTFGSGFFFESSGQFANWKSLRQDSGDPHKFIYKACDWWRVNGEDPIKHQIIFSDSLDIDKILVLDALCDVAGTNAIFGWGTNLMNDLGVKPLNIVMKAVEADGSPLVKLSDDIGKATGPKDQIEAMMLALGVA